MNKLTTTLSAAATVALALMTINAGAADYTWRGTADNPVWDTTTANWLSGGSTTTWVNDSASSNVKFDSQGAKDITVTADGVQGMELDIYGGDHTLSGGPVTVNVLDTDGGNLTIYNRLTCTNTTSGWGFRMHGGNGTFTVGNGGYLDAYFVPFSGNFAGKLLVLTNGTFRANFNSGSLNNSNKPTIYFNGGTLIPANGSSITSLGGSTKLVLGAGGMHVAPRESGWTYFPGPIGTDTALPTDGGLIIGNLSDYLYMKNVASTFRGGIHLIGTGGAVGFESNQTLGKTPDSPEDNIFFECPSNTVSSKLVAHGSVTLNANRNIRIGNGVTAQLSGYNSDSRLTVKGAISCENPEHGHLYTVAYSGSSPGPVTLAPGADRTNHLSRLFVGVPTTIASGTTLLQGSTGSGYDNNSPLNIRSGGSLTVSGSEVRTTGSGMYATMSGPLTISDGLVDLQERELLHASSAAATTTVKNGGRLNVGSIRMSGAAGTDASKSVLNLETGGVIRVTGDIYIHRVHSGHKATVNCNGGTLEWANTAASHNCPVGTDGEHSLNNTVNGLTWNVKEGGLVVSNDVVCYFRPALISGAANDGGLTKWGSETFALFNTGSTFNGPVTIMQGYFRLGNPGVIPATGTARVNTGAYFYLNTYAQTLARIEGSGTFGELNRTGSQLTVTSAIAPGMGAEELGTLTVSGGAISFAPAENGTIALEIDVDEEGQSDCFSYPADLDLSQMTLRVNDLSKLAKDCKYTIAEVSQGMSISGSFDSTNLPEGWTAKIAPGGRSLFLEFPAPFTMVVR